MCAPLAHFTHVCTNSIKGTFVSVVISLDIGACFDQENAPLEPMLSIWSKTSTSMAQSVIVTPIHWKNVSLLVWQSQRLIVQALTGPQIAISAGCIQSPLILEHSDPIEIPITITERSVLLVRTCQPLAGSVRIYNCSLLICCSSLFAHVFFFIGLP